VVCDGGMRRYGGVANLRFRDAAAFARVLGVRLLL